jgi:hypothetical protein
MNLTANWDGTVDSFLWSKMVAKSILQLQLMEQNYLKWIFLGWQNCNKCATDYKGDFDVNDLIGFSGNSIIVTRQIWTMLRDFFFRSKEKHLETNHQCKYSNLRFMALSKTERRYVTTDGKKMLVWVILPQILMLQKKYTTFILSGRTKARWHNSILSVGIFS